MLNPENIAPKDLGAISKDEITSFIRHIDAITTPLGTDDSTWQQEVINELKAWLKDHPDVPLFDGFEKSEE